MIFASPWFLFGTALAAAPIVIHLWFRRKLKRIPFSNLDFLRRTEAQRFGWLRLRDILILILRCLIIVFLFVSLARPLIPGRFFFSERLASLVLIFDNSLSMSYADNFSTAKETARKLIDRYSSRAEFLILPLCRPESDTALIWESGSRAKERLGNLALTHQKGSLKEVLEQNRPPIAQHDLEYVYIGDCQAVNFAGIDEPVLGQISFHAMKIRGGSNTTVTNVELSDPVSIPEDNYQLRISVANHAAARWHGAIEVKAGAFQAGQEIEIAAHSRSEFEFSLPVQSGQGIVTIYDDSLTADNRRYFSKRIPYETRVLAVNANPYLKAGLGRRDTAKAPFVVEFAPALSGHDLPKYDVIVLNGIAEISAGEKIRIKNFLADRTKGLICFLGDRAGENLREIIAPCQIEEYLVPRGFLTLDWIDIRNRVTNVFKTANALRGVKFYRFQKLGSKGKIIARLGGDHPLIVQTGNIFVIAAEFDPANTDIVYKASFVPLLYRLIVSAGLHHSDREFIVGDPSPGALTAPNGLTLIKGETLSVPGFFLDRSDSIAVNVDPAESDLRPLGTEQARALGIKIIDHDDYLGDNELSGFFLMLALIALLTELGLLLIR